MPEEPGESQRTQPPNREEKRWITWARNPG